MLSSHPTLRSGTPLAVPSSPNRSRLLLQCRRKAGTAARPFDPMVLTSSTIARSFNATMMGASASGQIPIIQWLSYAIAAFAAYQLAQVQDEKPSGDVCPRCDGTGKEACICNRWSDGDSGCQSCNYTGHTQCKACRGGGTAVPIAVTIRKDDHEQRPQ